MGHLKRIFEEPKPAPSPTKHFHSVYQNEADQAVIDFLKVLVVVALVVFGIAVAVTYAVLR
ncbi:MAG: hypothetical protein AAB597_03590 [Patescibacteria group bacterium]